jgi:hypothetical protein
VGWDFGYCGHYWPLVPAPGDSDGDCGEIGGMKIGRGINSFLIYFNLKHNKTSNVRAFFFLLLINRPHP